MRNFTLKRQELLLVGLFALVSAAVLAALLSKGRTLGGAESQVGADQLQYLSWIVSSAEHGTISSLWDIPAQSGSAFFHPGFWISGLLNRLGLPIVASYQAWKLVAIPALAVAAIAWVRRFLPAGGARTAALALVLFGLSPVGAVIGWNALAGGFRARVEFAAGEFFAPAWLWGYMMTALAIALMIVAILLCDPGSRTSGSGARRIWAAAGAALFCSWLQPWQGAELVAVVLLADVVMRRRREPGFGGVLLGRLPMAVGAIVPLAYYHWLGGNEQVWRIAAHANNTMAPWSAGVWLAALLPWLPAAAAYRVRPQAWIDFVLLAMPLLMISEYAVIATTGSGTFPFHAVQGIGFFLGVLAVRGGLTVHEQAWWAQRRWLVVGFCLLMCLPGTAHRLNLMRLEIHRSEQPYFLEPGEEQALRWLHGTSLSGGVLAPIKAGLTVPAHARRSTWVGELSWTPDFRRRVQLAEDLFKGRLDESEAERLIDSSRARFLYADCGHTGDLGPVLANRVARIESFGCARVWVLKRRGVRL